MINQGLVRNKGTVRTENILGIRELCGSKMMPEKGRQQVIVAQGSRCAMGVHTLGLYIEYVTQLVPSVGCPPMHRPM